MSQTAELYRMMTDTHICPFGLKSKDLLQRKGFKVVDHKLESREAADEFKEKHGVKTTPQTFIEGQRIGGYEDLKRYFGETVESDSETSYQPVIAIFAVCFLASLALAWAWPGEFSAGAVIMRFVALSMCVLAIQKLQDLRSFSNMFITYDLLAMRKVRYAYVYPFLEAWAGIGMLAQINPWLVAPFSLFIGSIGAFSVFKAVYIDKRELKCACVGGGSNVPLGFVSLSENLFMVGAAVYMFSLL